MNEDSASEKYGASWLAADVEKLTAPYLGVMQKDLFQMPSLKENIVATGVANLSFVSDQMRLTNSAFVEAMRASAVFQSHLDMASLGSSPASRMMDIKTDVALTGLSSVADLAAGSLKLSSAAQDAVSQISAAQNARLKSFIDQQIVTAAAARPAQELAAKLSEQILQIAPAFDQRAVINTTQFAGAMKDLTVLTPDTWKSLADMFVTHNWVEPLSSEIREPFVVDVEDVEDAAQLLDDLESDPELADELLTKATGTSLNDFQLMTNGERIAFVGAVFEYLSQSGQALLSAGENSTVVGVVSRLLVLTVVYILAVEAINADVQNRRSGAEEPSDENTDR